MRPFFLGWFPSPAFANAFVGIVIVAVLADGILPRLSGGRRPSAPSGIDRGSSVAIQIAATVGFYGAAYLRYRKLGLVPPWVQFAALAVLILGTLLRDWSIVVLGRFFSRVVQIDLGHRLITVGPYRWLRHPAYTGMLAMDAAIALCLGSWAGALFMMILVLAATAYRIRVEEQALLDRFGEVYRAYARRTWKLFPGW